MLPRMMCSRQTTRLMPAGGTRETVATLCQQSTEITGAEDTGLPARRGCMHSSGSKLKAQASTTSALGSRACGGRGEGLPRGSKFDPVMGKKRTSSTVGSSRGSATVKDTTTRNKRKAKKWSKDKTRQKQKELDDQVDAVYAVGLIFFQAPSADCYGSVYRLSNQ
jgi:hypothetical protein